MSKYNHNQPAFTPLDISETSVNSHARHYLASQAHLNSQRYLTGFTLIELLVTIGIIALLMAIALPATSLARGFAKQIACKSNLRTIGWAFRMYLDDNRLTMPPAFNMPSAHLSSEPPITKFLNIYLKDPHIFKCHADNGIKYPDQGKSYFEMEGSSYEYNVRLGGLPVSASRMAQSGEKEINIPVMYDYQPFHGPPGRPNSKSYLYADGHVSDLRDQN